MSIRDLELWENFIDKKEEEFIKLLNLPSDWELIRVSFSSTHVYAVVISPKGQQVGTDIKMDVFQLWIASII